MDVSSLHSALICPTSSLSVAFGALGWALGPTALRQLAVYRMSLTPLLAEAESNGTLLSPALDASDPAQSFPLNAESTSRR